MLKKGAKSVKLYERKIVVEGTGEFPFDMLRYDACHPASERDSGEMGRTEYDSPRSIRLIMTTGADRDPTTDRWASFGWLVIGVELGE